MSYKLIGVRPTHEEMKKMVGTELYAINSGEVNTTIKESNKCFIDKVLIVGIKIGANDKWEFEFDTEYETFEFEENEPLFASKKSLLRYAKANNIILKRY